MIRLDVAMVIYPILYHVSLFILKLKHCWLWSPQLSALDFPPEKIHKYLWIYEYSPTVNLHKKGPNLDMLNETSYSMKLKRVQLVQP